MRSASVANMLVHFRSVVCVALLTIGASVRLKKIVKREMKAVSHRGMPEDAFYHWPLNTATFHSKVMGQPQHDWLALNRDGQWWWYQETGREQKVIVEGLSWKMEKPTDYWQHFGRPVLFLASDTSLASDRAPEGDCQTKVNLVSEFNVQILGGSPLPNTHVFHTFSAPAGSMARLVKRGLAHELTELFKKNQINIDDFVVRDLFPVLDNEGKVLQFKDKDSTWKRAVRNAEDLDKIPEDLFPITILRVGRGVTLTVESKDYDNPMKNGF